MAKRVTWESKDGKLDAFWHEGRTGKGEGYVSFHGTRIHPTQGYGMYLSMELNEFEKRVEDIIKRYNDCFDYITANNFGWRTLPDGGNSDK